jgi:DNA-binding NtrC family response regulator
MLHALLFSNDTDAIVRLSDVFRETGFAVQAARSPKEARSALLRDMPDVAVMDCDALGPEELNFLANSRLGNVLELMLMMGDPELESTMRGMEIVASDFLAKPVDAEKLRSSLERIVSVATQPGMDSAGTVKAAGLGIMHGESLPMRRLFTMLRKVSATDMTVLLVGESGVGKELGAQMVHALGDHSSGPLLAVNCGAISPEILESELFGHEKGSFTGASRLHHGFFECASGGTLFLDEITEMSPALQVKLLRVLESGRVRRVGAEREFAIDARIIAATNRDPDEAMERGALREDLYYRLAQFPIRIPPLRERGEDVLLLARHFLAELNASSGITKEFSPEVLELLRLHSWPGNVRELRNAICRAYVLSAETIEADDLPPGVKEGGPIDRDYLRVSVGAPLAEVERRAILATVEHLDGNKKAAAQALGISLKTLYTKLKQYRLANS